ncbi:hypothetical protein GCM10022393_10860 [Aquimarina addita]|uniref:Uncharacterized protein n=1 Tax=Aquimarina addita TaxID=870485 RepID=A0ABP7XD96_9FLAO
MKMTLDISEKKIEEIHFDNLTWKSHIDFIEKELQFIERLISSYVFEPTTPNLFERLHEYKNDITNVKNQIYSLRMDLIKHENDMGGILECDTVSCDTFFYQQYKKMTQKFADFQVEFSNLKNNVFKYAGGVLKKNKK